MRFSYVFASLIYSVLLIPQLYGQNTKLLNADYVQWYKENAELSYTSPGGEIGAPSKYLINGKLTTNYMILGTDKFPVAFSVIPDFTVRVRNERSAGVRTPSFKLGGVFYVRLARTSGQFRFMTLGYTHHSNGQDGDAINPDGTTNTYNGNFSTNYLTLKYHFSKTIPGGTTKNLFILSHSTGLEWHKWFSYERALEHSYGFTRLLYNFSLRKYSDGKENWRLNSESSYAINPMSGYHLGALKKRLNAEISFHYALPFMNNVFLMAATGYYGEDPYNIYYQDKYAYLRLGLSSGFLRQKK
ncbi:hypothetical protein [Pedobacter frigoris]|uniref:hypothetical protein n=1 Tax=Pedobacter frigoris TaxID=2571272 RepID=UPI00292F2E47|nr:hypothetical protein [Pedobacter frigoris]